MNKETGRAGARERSREFAGDMPGFTDARHHYAALASQQEFDGAGEVVVELRGQAAHSVGFNFEHGASQRECPVAIDFRYHARSITKAHLRRAGHRAACSRSSAPKGRVFCCVQRPRALKNTRSGCARQSRHPPTNEDARRMTSPLELLLLLCSVAGVVVFRFFNLPPMLGYLAVGIIVGPHAAGIAPDSERAQHLAEFGVVFLMFSIGLEFSLSKLRSMRRIVFGLGASQVAGTIALALLFGWIANVWTDMSWEASIALGGALSMSSTAIVSKMLAERLELESEHGRNIFGVLLFQDLAVVPLLIIIAAFGNGNSKELAFWLALAAIKIVVALTVLLFLGQKFMTRWFNIVARRRSQ